MNGKRVSSRYVYRNVTLNFRSRLTVFFLLIKNKFAKQIIKIKSYKMNSFDVNELMVHAEAYVGQVIDP